MTGFGAALNLGHRAWRQRHGDRLWRVGLAAVQGAGWRACAIIAVDLDRRN